MLIYFKVWTVVIIIVCYFGPSLFVFSSVPLLYNLKRDYANKPIPEAFLMYYLIPTNFTNSKIARYIRQTSFYLHFVLTIPILLIIFFMDPNFVNFDFDNDHRVVAGLNWANLELNKPQHQNYKYLVFGLSIGCGIFSILVDLLFTIFW